MDFAQWRENKLIHPYEEVAKIPSEGKLCEVILSV